MIDFIRNYSVFRKLFRWIGVMVLAALFFWLQVRNTILPESTADEVLELLMYVMIFIGYGIRFWANGYRKGALTLPEKELVTWGPYAYIRHPLYLANITIVIGVLMSSFSLVDILIIGIPVVLCFIYVALREEKALLSIYGSCYEKYSNNTPRFIPKIKKVLETELKPFDLKYAAKEIVKMVTVMIFVGAIDTIIEYIPKFFK